MGEHEEDELDALLQRYEQQAAADAAAVQHRQAGSGAGGGSKRRKVSAAAQREEALSQPLGADNKGFKMLAALGYKEGQRIGKAGTGLAEPLPLLLKQDKLGLGRVSKKAAARDQQRQREQEAARRAAADAAAAEAGRHGQRQEYQARAAAAAAARRLEGQLRKAQQVCETLDTAAGVTSNVMWKQPAAAAAAAAVGNAATDDLLEALEHRHGKDAGAAVRAGREEAADFERLYQHQQAAAAAAAAARDVPSGDRGGAVSVDEAAEVGAADAAGGSDEQAAAVGEWELWQALPPAEQLAALIARLRGQYSYCLYCACRYDSEADMQQHCPGPSEADHE